MIDTLMNHVRSVRLGDPQVIGNLACVPLMGESRSSPAYVLLGTDTAPGIEITEIGEGGQVGRLRVQNLLESSLLLLDGQELIGAKQNRILNTDVLVPAGVSITVPVSCVEQGRWRHVSRTFRAGRAAPRSSQANKLRRVKRALEQGLGHDADQQAVWNEVRETLSRSESISPTDALHDAYASREHDIAERRAKLILPDLAVGVIFLRDGRVVSLDLFDRAGLMHDAWPLLCDSFLLEQVAGTELAAVDPIAQSHECLAASESVLREVGAGIWDPFVAAGAGSELRLESRELVGSALLAEDGSVLHLQAFGIGA